MVCTTRISPITVITVVEVVGVMPSVQTSLGLPVPYFEVFVADIPNPEKDWQDLSFEEIFEIFAERLKTPIEYKLSKLQE